MFIECQRVVLRHVPKRDNNSCVYELAMQQPVNLTYDITANRKEKRQLNKSLLYPQNTPLHAEWIGATTI